MGKLKLPAVRPVEFPKGNPIQQGELEHFHSPDIFLQPKTGGLTMEKDVTLSCPDGYELACMRDRESDKCCCCCVGVVSPIRKSS